VERAGDRTEEVTGTGPTNSTRALVTCVVVGVLGVGLVACAPAESPGANTSATVPAPASRAAATAPARSAPASASDWDSASAVHSVEPTGPATGDKPYSWNFRRNTAHKVPEIPTTARVLAARYGALWTGPDRKRVYLTFDEGYENGWTPRILDILKRDGVKATFFVTATYVRDSPKLVRRMVAEGHTVGNHSATHPSMPKLTADPKAFAGQFSRTADAFKRATGKPIARLFRPPMGDYSETSLAMARELGYTTVFWSFAHADYDEKNQPPVDKTLALILQGSHPGAIYLLHGVSSSDTKALDAAIRGLREQGYGFGVLEPTR
jgi:peptidoglycan-N-acetylmuramic acid deacetylase